MAVTLFLSEKVGISKRILNTMRLSTDLLSSSLMLEQVELTRRLVERWPALETSISNLRLACEEKQHEEISRGTRQVGANKFVVTLIKFVRVCVPSTWQAIDVGLPACRSRWSYASPSEFC